MGVRAERVLMWSEREKHNNSAEELWFDMIVQGIGWWRVLYGDLKHALDLRLMTGRCITNLDASYPLFQGVVAPSVELEDSFSSHPGANLERMGLVPIPEFLEKEGDGLPQLMWVLYAKAVRLDL
ncbi:hypothetical protein JVU11DRAFT_10648 [Chiua virens]|nr:hypothetical protein JVU11DRAFT_10648 [Chiua virens]